MSVLRVRGGRRLSGTVRPPPDKSVAHRALMLGALGLGDTRIAPWDPGEDVRSTLRVLQALGVHAKPEPGALVVRGRAGPARWIRTDDDLDCGNSGTTMRLMSGLLAACPGAHRLTGDPSLRRRPMERLRVLEAMGVRFEGSFPLRAPFVLHGQARLRARRTRLQVASAQVKSALLLAGLYADGPSRIEEPGGSRDHTERWLRWLGVSVRSVDGVHTVAPLTEPWKGREMRVPPDFSSAAFLLGAAWVAGGTVEVEAGANPTRIGFAEVLKALGARVERTDLPSDGPEPVARWSVAPGSPRAARIRGETALRALDELPLAAGLMAFVPGESRIEDGAELRVKESDRIGAMHQVLTGFGVASTPTPDGLIIQGGDPKPADVDAAGDHRVAMTAAVMGLGLQGSTRIRGAEVVRISYPGFVQALQTLGADVAWED